MLTPVVLPLGCAIEDASPSATMSSAMATMGIFVCRLLYGAGCRSTAALDDIDLGFNQFRCVLRKKIDVLPKFAVVDSEVFALDETITAQFLEERGSVLCVCV